MTRRTTLASRRLSLVEGERRARRNHDAPSREAAIRKDIAVHDAIRLLGLEPATGPRRGYDARGPKFRYRIAGCTPSDPLLGAEVSRPENWDRILLVSMTAELEPLAIDELTVEGVRSTRSVARLRKIGRSRWRRE